MDPRDNYSFAGDEDFEPKDPSPYDGDMPDEEDDRPDMNDLNDFEDEDEDDLEELDFDDDEERFDRAAGDAGADE